MPCQSCNNLVLQMGTVCSATLSSLTLLSPITIVLKPDRFHPYICCFFFFWIFGTKSCKNGPNSTTSPASKYTPFLLLLQTQKTASKCATNYYASFEHILEISHSLSSQCSVFPMHSCVGCAQQVGHDAFTRRFTTHTHKHAGFNRKTPTRSLIKVMLDGCFMRDSSTSTLCIRTEQTIPSKLTSASAVGGLRGTLPSFHETNK